MGEWVKKPKTPEEELRDELKEIIDAAMSRPLGFLNDTDEKLVDYMLDNYNITKKPQWGAFFLLIQIHTSTWYVITYPFLVVDHIITIKREVIFFKYFE